MKKLVWIFFVFVSLAGFAQSNTQTTIASTQQLNGTMSRQEKRVAKKLEREEKKKMKRRKRYLRKCAKNIQKCTDDWREYN